MLIFFIVRVRVVFSEWLLFGLLRVYVVAYQVFSLALAKASTRRPSLKAATVVGAARLAQGRTLTADDVKESQGSNGPFATYGVTILSSIAQRNAVMFFDTGWGLLLSADFQSNI